MRLFIDCEFNGDAGQLISMALVPEHGHYWYQVLDCPFPEPWVAEHVMPKLAKAPISHDEFQRSLEEYLMGFDTVHIVADWPADLVYFNVALLTEPGFRLNTPPLTMEVLRVDAPSRDPHNALADAVGIRGYVIGHGLGVKFA